MLAGAESVGGKRRGGFGPHHLLRSKMADVVMSEDWRGGGTGVRSFGLVPPHQQSFSARKRARSYLTKAEWVLGGRSLPGEHPGKLISKSVGV